MFKKLLEWSVLALAIFWMGIAFTGMRLPYLHTSFAWELRAYFLFPTLLLMFFYLGFIRKKGSGKTGYGMVMEATTGRYETIKITLGMLAGLIRLPAILAYTSIFFPAWIVSLTAVKPFAHVYLSKCRVFSKRGSLDENF